MRFTDRFRLARADILERIDRFDDYHEYFTSRHELPFGRLQQGREGEESVAVADERTGANARDLFMLASNDYLGLSRHPRIRATITDHLEHYGSASSGSPLLSGAYKISRRLERRLAELHGMDDTLLFCSTYNANLGAIAGLLTRRDYCVVDQFAHTSIQDGARMAGCRLLRFRHNSPDGLRTSLDSVDPKKTLVFVDSLYSMEGSFCELEGICKVVREYGALLAVDEAHAVGVVGKKGEGLVRSLGLSSEVDIVTSSLGKALASHGGYISGSRKVCNYLRYVATPYIFSSSLAPVNVAVALEALDILEEGDLVARLQDNILFAHAVLKKNGLAVPDAVAGILPIAIGDEKRTLEIANDLDARGIFVNPVIFPAVAKGHGILRLSMSALHSRDKLKWALAEVAKSVRSARLTARAQP